MGATWSIGNPVGSAKKAKEHLRVLSVPWCYVEIDGKPLGPSGQAKPFEVTEGKHTLTFRRNGRILTKKIDVPKGQKILVKATLDKGIINVIQE